VYRDHDKEDDFPEKDDLDRRIRAALDQLIEWDDIHGTDLMKPYQVYSLVLALMHLQEPVNALRSAFEIDEGQMADEADVLVNLTSLADALEKAPAQSPFGRFVAASSDRTNVGTQRTERFTWFCKALVDDLPE